LLCGGNENRQSQNKTNQLVNQMIVLRLIYFN